MTRRRATAVLLGWLIGVIVAGLGAPSASAHAVLANTDPSDGSRLTAPPSRVTITFDEAVGLGVGFVRVIDSRGRRVDAADANHPGGRGEVISIGLRPGLGDDTYLVSWLVVSADSHPVQGSIRFVVGDGALLAVTDTSPPATGGPVGRAFDAVRWTGFVGLVLLGGSWLVHTVWRDGRWLRRTRLLVAAGWSVTAASTVGEFVLQGPYSAASGFSTALHGDLLDATLRSAFGQLHVVRLVLLGLLGWMLVVALSGTAVIADRSMAALLALVGLGVLVTYPAGGHARAAEPQWLAVGSDVVHLAAMSAWLGGLVVLLVVLLPLGEPEELRAVVPVFSRVAYGAVAVLAVTGTYQAWRESGTVDALTSTTYGYLVLTKVALFAVLIALGAASRRIVLRRAIAATDNDAVDQAAAVDGERGPAVTRIRRAVFVEALLALTVLGVTAVLVSEPPGRAAAATAAARGEPRSGSAELGKGRAVRLTVDPARRGAVTVSARLSGSGAQSIACSASLMEPAVGPLTVRLRRQADGDYRAEGVLLPAAGRWVFTVTVRFGEFDAVVATVTVRVS